MSPEIESHGLEMTEKVFSEQAVHVISGGKGGVKPGELRSPNRDGPQPYLLTGQPDLEALRRSSRPYPPPAGSSPAKLPVPLQEGYTPT